MFDEMPRWIKGLITLSLISSGVGFTLPVNAQELESSKKFCNSDLSRWSSLISLRPVEPFSFPSVPWMPQPIENAAGEDINIDYYSVIVDKLPRGLTAEQLLRHIRLNLNQFGDTTMGEFEPYSQSDAKIWNSSNPVGAVVSIDLALPDNASVVVSEANHYSWIFSAVATEGDGKHPISGNRRFGYFRWKGKYVFFTRGADRATTGLHQLATHVGSFKAGERLWQEFQEQIAAYVNKQGGRAKVGRMVSHRCAWEPIRRKYHRPTTPWR